jgi:GTP-binding protein LepA
MPVSPELIRNFSIIAHIDHGKTTLADRIMDLTGAVTEREQQAQLLDRMELEQERGITIKAQAIRLSYKAKDGKTYQLNLIDTPGHVDFHYEVSRSLAACEGCLLVVDAAQGVEAQTLANVYLALDNDLAIVPVLNKIDLPVARCEEVIEEIEEVIGLDAQDALRVSAKSGLGCEDVLEAVVLRIPPPTVAPEKPLRALIFDSWYDSFRGVVALVRVFDGKLKKGQRLRFMATDKEYEVNHLGVYTPALAELKVLECGEVGILSGSIKDIADVRVGDTVTDADDPCEEPLVGFQSVQPMVFAGVFTVDSKDYQQLKDALGKLTLNDAAVSYEPETSAALGFGFRCGFLGLLHMEIVQERLEREFNLDLITTAPSVIYRVYDKAGAMSLVDNPAKVPDLGNYSHMEEPMIDATVHCPQEYIGPVVQLCEERRGIQKGIDYGSMGRVQVKYQLPMAEVVFGFYDRLKTLSRGYASLEYEPAGYLKSDLVRVDMLSNGDNVDALSVVCHKSVAQRRGLDVCVKMKEVIHRQMFAVAIQAAIGSRIISRTTVKALRKDVTAKCYGGDISRKRKLLEKQKAGKKRMKAVGSVELPQEAFLTILQVD